MKLSVQILSALFVLMLIIVVLERDTLQSSSDSVMDNFRSKKIRDEKPWNTASEAQQTSIIDYTLTLKKLLMAEESRDVDLAASFFANEISRYWDHHKITNSDLKKLYFTAFSKRSNAYNIVLKIDRISEREYLLDTEFHCTLIKTGEEIFVFSTIKFVFDNNGKIIVTYKVNE
jgi:hypothetical protein